MPDRAMPPPAERLAPTPTLTAPEVAARAGVDLALAKRVWRALGMPEAADDEVQFQDRDVQALVVLRTVLDVGVPAEEVLNLTRLYGRALAQIADAETRVFREHMLGRLLQDGVDGDVVDERIRPVVDALLDISAHLLDHAHRRQLSLALDALRAGGGEGTSERLAVGFVDLVDFSRISEDLAGEELGGLVDAFEDLAVQACSDAAVRLVKVIGDAVMFVSTAPDPALKAARAVVRGAEEHEVLPAARAGLDVGEAVALGGDYFGRPVNVAARITAFARPGTVVVSREFVDVLDKDGVETTRIRSRRLKGVGRVELFKVRDGSEGDLRIRQKRA